MGSVLKPLTPLCPNGIILEDAAWGWGWGAFPGYVSEKIHNHHGLG